MPWRELQAPQSRPQTVLTCRLSLPIRLAAGSDDEGGAEGGRPAADEWWELHGAGHAPVVQARRGRIPGARRVCCMACSTLRPARRPSSAACQPPHDPAGPRCLCLPLPRLTTPPSLSLPHSNPLHSTPRRSSTRTRGWWWRRATAAPTATPTRRTATQRASTRTTTPVSAACAPVHLYPASAGAVRRCTHVQESKLPCSVLGARSCCCLLPNTCPRSPRLAPRHSLCLSLLPCRRGLRLEHRQRRARSRGGHVPQAAPRRRRLRRQLWLRQRRQRRLVTGCRAAAL